MAEQAEPIVIKNDGSFLEQFLKLQQAGVAEEAKVSLVSAADDDKHNEVVKEESEEDIDGEPLESVNNDGSLSTENSRTQQGVQDAGAVEDSGARRDEKAQTPPCDVQSGADSEQNKKRGPFARLGKAPFASVKRPAGDDSSRRKKKKEEEIDNPAWEAYMKEVEKYRGGSCKSEREYTPLVK